MSSLKCYCWGEECGLVVEGHLEIYVPFKLPDIYVVGSQERGTNLGYSV